VSTVRRRKDVSRRLVAWTHLTPQQNMRRANRFFRSQDIGSGSVLRTGCTSLLTDVAAKLCGSGLPARHGDRGRDVQPAAGTVSGQLRSQTVRGPKELDPGKLEAKGRRRTLQTPSQFRRQRNVLGGRLPPPGRVAVASGQELSVR